MEVPELARAIQEERISICKASRIVSALEKSNAEELIEFASKNSWRAIEAEMARRRPGSAGREKVKPVNEQLVEVKLYVTPEDAKILEKAQNLLSSKLRGAASLSRTAAQAWAEYVERHDPVRKAERAQKRREKEKSKASDSADLRQSEANSVRTDSGSDQNARRDSEENQSVRPNGPKRNRRIRLTAEENHAVNARDHGRCTFVDEHGDRCPNERWLETHHKIKVSEGGTNHPSNLATLCSFHHDLVHQVSLPLDGQVTWLRERGRVYQAGH
jgi:hypothetical protein